MLNVFILLLPAATCLFWVIFHSMVCRRVHTYPITVVLLTMMGVFLATDALYCSPYTTFEGLHLSSLVAVFSAPCIIPLTWMYLRRLRYKRRDLISIYLWVFIPVILFTGGFFIFNLAQDNSVEHFLESFYSGGSSAIPHSAGIVRMYYLWVIVVFRVVIALEFIILAIYMASVMSKEGFSVTGVKAFLNEGGALDLEKMQMMCVFLFFLVMPIKVSLFRNAWLAHPWLGILSALLLTLFINQFAFMALFGAKKSVTRKEIRNAWRFNYGDADKAQIVEEMIADLVEDAEAEALMRIQDKIEENLDIEGITHGKKLPDLLASNLFSAVASSGDDDDLLSRFQSLMVQEKLYLRPGLTVTDVAERLHTNKTYISKMVNSTYNLGFPELVNTLRVDYAEEYILNHRQAKQDTIAMACGFVSASSFNNIFKKITGLTPKMWVAVHDKQES